MTLSSDLGNSNYWQSFYTNTFAVQSVPGGYVAIPKTTLPVLTESLILLAATSTSNPGRNWNTGGWLTPFFQNAISLARLSSYWLPLNASRLIALPPDYSTSYQLQFSTPVWMQDVTLTLFQYTGPYSKTGSAITTDHTMNVSTSPVVLLAANTQRKGATLFNASDQVVYVDFASSVTASDYGLALSPNTYYELPFDYQGAISGICPTGPVSVNIREFT